MSKITKKFELDEAAIKEAIASYLAQNHEAYVKVENIVFRTTEDYSYGDQPTGTYTVSAEASE